MYADLIKALVPLIAFMLLPIWIPLGTAIVGRIVDALRAGTADPVATRINEVKRHSLARRTVPEAA